MLDQARKLGVSADDLLTSDGEGFACEVLRDFTASVGQQVTVTFKKGDRLRERQTIGELRKGRCPDIASLEPELQRRVLQFREHPRQSQLGLLAVISAIASMLSAGGAWFAALRH